MRIKTLLVGIITMTIVVFGINSVIRLRMGKSNDKKDADNKIHTVTKENLYEFLEFNNGTGKINFQHHHDNYKKINQVVFTDNALKLYSRGYLYFSMWELYSSLEKMVHAFHYNMYIETENQNSYPGLPINKFYTLAPQADEYINAEKKYYDELGKNAIYNNHLTLRDNKSDANEMSYVKETNYFYNHGVILEDSTVSFINVSSINRLRQICFSLSIKYLSEYIQSPDRIGSYDLKSRLKLTQLFGASGQFEMILPIWNNTDYDSSVFQDSLDIYYLTTDIVKSIPFINYLYSLNNKKKIILVSDSFPYLNDLLVFIATSWGLEDANINQGKINQLIQENYCKYDDYILTPLFVLSFSNYLYNNNQILEASTLISNFWFFDAKYHPPQYWWFENYPDYLVRSYSIGKWDGGRLQLWTSDYMDIMGSDPLLKTNYSLLELFNSIVFKDLDDPLHSK